MDILLAILTSAAWLFCALGIGVNRLRPAAALVLLLAAAAALAAGFLAPGERTLAITHTFAGYEPGLHYEPSAVDFVVDHATAPGWQWAAAFAAYALPWALLLWALRRRQAPANPFLLPLLAAWTGIAAWLWMQLRAAPAAVVQPFGLERILFPAGLSLTILAARHAKALLPMLAQLSVGVVAMRLPVALFSKLASDRSWGTSLDTHSVTEFLNPMNQLQVHTTPGSSEQQFLLIWCQHLIVMPALFMLSYAGVGIGLFLYFRHGPNARPRVP